MTAFEIAVLMILIILIIVYRLISIFLENSDYVHFVPQRLMQIIAYINFIILCYFAATITNTLSKAIILLYSIYWLKESFECYVVHNENKKIFKETIENGEFSEDENGVEFYIIPTEEEKKEKNQEDDDKKER